MSRFKLSKSSLGKERIIETFLWFPLRLGTQWRWLERVRIFQKVLEIDVGGSMEWGKYAYRWCNIRWDPDIVDNRTERKKRIKKVESNA